MAAAGPTTSGSACLSVASLAAVPVRLGQDGTVSQPILFLTVGLPGTGKTTAARQIETEHAALRLTKDEWMKALYGDENPSAGWT